MVVIHLFRWVCLKNCFLLLLLTSLTTALLSQEASDLIFSKWSGKLNIPDPVAISFDDRGNAYVTQTQRRKVQDLDIRQHPQWIEADLSFESVQDKQGFYRKILSPENPDAFKHTRDFNDDGIVDFNDLKVLSEKIYKISDTDHDGVADTMLTFAEDFKTEVTGIAAGVLWHQNKVYATIAPDVWRMEDTNLDGQSDQREIISTGYGLHIAYAGHDMHGLTTGPDGRIYWSIGDKGVSVTDNNGKRWHYPNQGAVMRCEPDGSNFEVFAHGLRNVQELAFDEYGNLFGVDNDSDNPGEMERFVYIGANSDSGWRCNYQYRKRDYNPWTEEGLWKPQHDGRSAYSLPPICNYRDGPCGFVYNPGTALGTGWEKTFFLTGAPRGDQWAFQTKPKGAGFEMINSRLISKGNALIGWNFAPDGALYAVDWAGGYPLNQTGAIWKMDVKDSQKHPLREQTESLIGDDFAALNQSKLFDLLGWPDQRVRLKAQFELVKRKAFSNLLGAGYLAEAEELAIVHMIWGLGQSARLGHTTGDEIARLLTVSEIASNPELRAQIFRVAPDVSTFPARTVAKGMQSLSMREQYFALLAFKKHGDRKDLDLMVNLIQENSGKDLYIRHAAIEALTKFDAKTLGILNTHNSVEVQLCAVVALRRNKAPEIRRFLKAESDFVSTEAALGIYDDFSILPAMSYLAEALESSDNNKTAFVLRAINANARIGSFENAARVAKWASDETQSEEHRLFALKRLIEWNSPPKLDAVTGRYRSSQDSIAEFSSVRQALEPFIQRLLVDGSAKVQAAAMHLSRKYDLLPSHEILVRLIKQETSDESVRIAALQAMADEKGVISNREVLREAINSNSSKLRVVAMQYLSAAEPNALDTALGFLKSEKLIERQEGVRSLLKLQATKEISKLTQELVTGNLDPGLQLEVIEAASILLPKDEKFKSLLAGRSNLMNPKSFQECLEGGDPKKGETVFMNHIGGQCVRCHKYEKRGPGSNIGPNLWKIGERDPKYLLESLVAPQATIARNFGNVSIDLKDGANISGLFVEESEKGIKLKDPTSGAFKFISHRNVSARSEVVSVMPPMGAMMQRSELRDLIAYLSTLISE